ncbi:MAG: hypothetical protein ABL957_16660, partial [Parvularculaceae bacterium]
LMNSPALTKLLTIAVLALLAACGQKKADAAAAPAPNGEGSGATSADMAAFEPSGLAAAPAQGSGFAAPLPQNLPPGVVVLQRAAIPDPGVIAPGTALTALVPAGWTARGGVVRPRGLCAEPYAVDWSAVSADGLSSLSIFPTDIWQWSNTAIKSDCTPGAFANVREYLTARVQRAYPGARVLDYRQRDDFAKSAMESAKRLEDMARQMGLDWRIRVEGGEILFAYEQNGVEMRGTAGASARFQEALLQSPMGGEPLRTLTGMTLGTFASSAPNGRLDFDLVEASRRSIAPEPKWLDQLFALQAAIGDIQVQGTKDRAAIIVAGGAEATRSNIEAFRAMAGASLQNSRDSIDIQTRSSEPYPGSNAQDRMQRESIEAVRGVETYHDPVDNRAVQLDMTYGNAWRVNNQEAYILTKDPNFNPGQYGIEATQMGVVQ